MHVQSETTNELRVGSMVEITGIAYFGSHPTDALGEKGPVTEVMEDRVYVDLPNRGEVWVSPNNAKVVK